TLYVQFYNPEKFDYATAIGNNPNIRIVKFHSTVFHVSAAWSSGATATGSALATGVRWCRTEYSTPYRLATAQ
ncbi:MAG: hypothetical protein J6U52_05115, partial [Alistipes sp.]|nr:hypothetical protein [Alistipes sp.]